MSKALLVCFQASDAAALAGFASSVGMESELVLVEGNPTADQVVSALSERANGCQVVAAVSSMASKDAMARLAGALDAAMVTDVTETVSANQFKRPIVAGTMVETVEVLAWPAVFTIRPSGYSGSAAAPTSVSASAAGLATRTATHQKSGGRPDLTQAKVVVSGGRPLKDPETYEKLIGGLADKLGGATGATRAAVDSGIAPNESQVGQTGKIVAPDLYIAAGISGSTQHMAGIKDSKIIVAINTDADAPIFEFADFGLVADLYAAVPELIDKANS